jgi:hypothetical protein
MFIEEYPKLRPNEKARYMLDIFRLHFERAIAQLPKDSSDSVMNANKMLAELKALEERTLGNKRDGSNQAGMDTGKATL